MGIKAVGFDIDGTLYPDRYIRMRSIPFVISNLKNLSALYRARKAMRRNPSDPQIIANASEAEVSYLAVQLRCSIDKAREIRDKGIYNGWEKYFKFVSPCEGVHECLTQLRQAGLKIAVLSDFPIGRKLEYLGLEELIDVRLGFPDSGNLKPAPQPFMNMAEKLRVEPAQVIYIGNRIDYDVEGAESVGMKGLLILNSKYARIPNRANAYRSYKQIARYILSEVRK